MANATKRPAGRAASTRPKAKRQTAVERLTESLEAAQKAATALGEDVETGGRDLLRDVERMIAAARRDTAKLTHSVRGDLADLQKAVVRHSNGQQAKARPKKARPNKAGRKTPAKA